MPFGVMALLVLTLAGGAAVAGLITTALTLAERCSISIVVGIAGGAGVGYVLSVLLGVGTTAAIGGAASLTVLAVLIAVSMAVNPLTTWRASWDEFRAAPPWLLIVLTAVAATFFTLTFKRSLVEQDGSLQAGYQAVWSDWALHATTANSFAVGHNIPPQDPLFSGTPLRYPFLPDFHSSMLVVLGWGIGPALWVPCLMLCVAISILVMSLARRLSGSVAAGGLALAICVLGGGFGFVGFAADACTHSVTGTVLAATVAKTDTCTWSGLQHHPLSVIGDTVAGLRATMVAQPRAYDGLLTDAAQQAVPNTQWYTPLLSWWLPQRSFLFGFAMVLVVLTLLVAAEEDARPQWPAYAAAGLLAGLLPLFHIHSLIALILLLPWFVLRRRSREWLVFGAAVAGLAVPRLLSLAGGPRGDAAAGNQFPWIEPGWMWSFGDAAANHPHPLLGVATLVHGGLDYLAALVHPAYWWFWISNTGVLLPVMVVAGLCWAWRSGGRVPRADRAMARISGLFGTPLLRFSVPFLLVFAAANVVVFQSWDWDNTKVLAYWQFGAAMLVSGGIVRLIRSGTGRAAVAVLTAVSLLLTGAVVVARMMPWSSGEARGAVIGPYAMVDAEEVSFAQRIEAATPRNAVILTSGGLNDPALVLAGRSSFLGYYGWQWSYGTDFGTRVADQATMYSGCGAAVSDADCPRLTLLRRYRIQYAEILDSQPVGGLGPPDRTWWNEHFRVVARSAHAVLYDVAGP